MVILMLLRGSILGLSSGGSGVYLLSHGFVAVTLTRSSLTLKKWEEGSNLIQERLDRCLCDLSWHCLFGESKVTNLGFWRSDHRPILLEVLEHPSPAPQVASLRGRRFHFEACWADIIKSAWANPGSDWVGFLQNIEGCTSHLAVCTSSKMGSTAWRSVGCERILLHYFRT
ncbi:hypothetical protein ACOSQ2_023352 [Xanthoceras sorbifolium]